MLCHLCHHFCHLLVVVVIALVVVVVAVVVFIFVIVVVVIAMVAVARAGARARGEQLQQQQQQCRALGVSRIPPRHDQNDARRRRRGSCRMPLWNAERWSVSGAITAS